VTLSTTLLLATLSLWARSQRTSDYLWCRIWRGETHRAPTRALWVITHRGGPVWHYRSADFWAPGLTGPTDFVLDLADAPRWVYATFEARDFQPLGPGDFDAFTSRVGGGFAWQSGARWKSRTLQWGEQINGHSHWYDRVAHHTLAVPWWFLALLFALAPTRAVWTWHKARRRPRHVCAGCGYDLRATADARGPLLPTCPECGRSATSP
jgi:hypothetical protein